MITSLNLLATVRVEFDNSESSIFLVDMMSGLVYGLDGLEASSSVRKEVIDNIRGHQEATMPDIPYEQIYEVMNTEKKLQEDNNKHIFRRRDE